MTAAYLFNQVNNNKEVHISTINGSIQLRFDNGKLLCTYVGELGQLFMRALLKFEQAKPTDYDKIDLIATIMQNLKINFYAAFSIVTFN
jgi:hypothetical protein